MPESVASTPGPVWIAVVFVLVVAPIYLLMRYMVGVVREAYGFAPVVDEGPDYRICQSCHNTVMEADFAHCPYCGANLPPSVGDDPEATL